MVNGDARSDDGTNGTTRKNDIIIITGKPENCENAKRALLVSGHLSVIGEIEDLKTLPYI